MSRRRRHPPPPAPAKTRPAPFHAPFEGLAKAVRTVAPPPAKLAAKLPVPPKAQPATRIARPEAPTPDDAETSFAAAMADVRRFDDVARIDAPAPASQTVRVPVDEDAETLAILSDLVTGNGHFDISDSTADRSLRASLCASLFHSLGGVRRRPFDPPMLIVSTPFAFSIWERPTVVGPNRADFGKVAPCVFTASSISMVTGRPRRLTN